MGHEGEKQSAPVASTEVRRVCQGPVMPIGGAENKNPGSAILERFVGLAGGDQAKIVIVPTASEDPEEMGQQYVKVFGKLGAPGAEWLRIAGRNDANGEEAPRLLEEATGIFITGGDQARLVSLMAGTEAMECIRRRNAEGVVVAGTSAGASIVGAHLMSGENMVPHNSNDAAARKGMVELVAGFGLLQDIIVDQHFSQRGRLGRLMTAYAANPGLLGIGLDEDTAVLITQDGTMEVLGSSMVTIVDGRNAVSDYYEREVGEVLTVVDSHLFVFGPGRRFDLDSRRPIGIGGA
ncbi:MAG: cyanophycinase [Chloroflexota bacterium]|nr:cyanophycinase [Chloroflexota bacterium]MDP9472664.1 cyanophycinase [Chloroflexota bacterium]